MRIKSILFLFGLLGFLVSQGQISITLRKSFIDSFSSKVTISGNFEIHKAHKRPNKADKDGDLHFAGYDKKIGLPMVAEIMNAASEPAALTIVKDNNGDGTRPANTVKLSGVWRIWCEHPGNESKFVQGSYRNPIFNSTNPDHVFEIHPVTKINDVNVMRSLKRIEGYEYKDAERAFTAYSNARCKIKKKGTKVTIETNGVGYNYVDFWIKLNADQHKMVSDGLFAFCSILKPEFNLADATDEDGEVHEEEYLISHKISVAFVKGTPEYDKLLTLNKGDYMRVTAIPRISLNLVKVRLSMVATEPDVLEWNLPFEMVVVGEVGN